MARALRFERLVRTGEVRDYADLARLGHVSHARITQIMNLLTLAPDIQEDILFLPRTLQGRVQAGRSEPEITTDSNNSVADGDYRRMKA